MDLPRHDSDGHPGQLQRGHWDVYRQAGAPGKLGSPRTAAVTCPTCGRLFCLVGHRIAADGACSPSVVCPWPGCDFHQFVRLVGWNR